MGLAVNTSQQEDMRMSFFEVLAVVLFALRAVGDTVSPTAPPESPAPIVRSAAPATDQGLEGGSADASAFTADREEAR